MNYLGRGHLRDMIHANVECMRELVLVVFIWLWNKLGVG
jgi:hypothetical protein